MRSVSQTSPETQNPNPEPPVDHSSPDSALTTLSFAEAGALQLAETQIVQELQTNKQKPPVSLTASVSLTRRALR
jgi:hypothetical protein